MYMTKKHLPRRMFLRGIGAGVALPLLDAMIPAGTALAQTAARPAPRLGFVYFPHGAVMDRWTPDSEGRDFELKQILEPLAAFRDRLTIVSNLDNPHANGPVHAITPGTWLSAVRPRISHDPFGGITADQIAAREIGQDTPMPSLEIATEEQGGSNSCDRDFGCSYAATISFRTPSTPLPMEHNPRKLFQRLFGQGDTPEERDRLTRQYASILDLIAADARSLHRSLGPADRAMLDDYLDSVREIERRVERMEARDLSQLDLPDAPIGVPDAFDDHIHLMFDMILLAWRANLTRVASFMMAAEVSNLTYNHIGVGDAFHPLSHHQENAAKLDRLARVQTYHSQVFARFVEQLAATPDGEGSMLDNAILLYGSNMSNSNAHDHYPLPSAIVGGGAGTIRGGQHLVYPERTPIANLLLTVLRRAGIDIDAVGDSSGELSEV